MNVVRLALYVFALIFALNAKVYSQAASKLDSQSTLKILVLGDSLSAAYKLPEEQGWVNLMAERIKNKGWAVNVANASVSGATTEAGLQLLPRALSLHKPDWVVLELGANDGLQGKPIPYITSQLERLITQIKASGAEVILLGIQLPPNFGKRYTEPFFNQYPALATKHRLPYLPFLLDGVAGNPQLMMTDGLHPSAEGQKKVLENVWKLIAPMIEEQYVKIAALREPTSIGAKVL